jgi:membrane-associated phospholipid phosphatase
MTPPITAAARRAALALCALACASACTDPATSSAVTARGDAGLTSARGAPVTLGFNALARHLVTVTKPNQQQALRAFAYLALAQREAALRTGAFRSFGHQGPTQLAISRASRLVLREFFPTAVDTIDAHNAAEVARYSTDTEEDVEALRIGAEVGTETVQRLRADGFDIPWSGSVPTGTGVWASQLEPPRAPLLPRFGQVKTFFLGAGDQFRPGPPPAVGSPAFQSALAEVRWHSDHRTPAQQKVAEFWAMATGPLVAGFWNEVADSLASRDRLPEREAAEALARMNTAAFDANVACHDAKYTYWLARPSQMDRQIVTAIGLPNHPSYPSNHSCLSGTAALVLADRFPRDAATLGAMSDEAGVSRIYAGLHYRFDLDAGMHIATNVARLAVTTPLRFQ